MSSVTFCITQSCSSTDNLGKQFGPRSGPGSKLFVILMVFLKEFIKKFILKKISRRQKSMKNYPVCNKFKALNLALDFGGSGFPTRSDTNRAVQPQTMARGLKFRTIPNNICSDVQADLHLHCLHMHTIKFSHDAALLIMQVFLL